MQLKQSNQLYILSQDDCKYRSDTKYAYQKKQQIPNTEPLQTIEGT